MNKRLFFLCAFLSVCLQTVAQHKISNLKCEYLIRPLGVDKTNPRLGWSILSTEKNIKQVAYTILVGTDSLKVVNNQGDVWNSGKVSSDTILVRYAGEKLKPSTKYFWKVQSWVNQSAVQSDTIPVKQSKYQSSYEPVQVNSAVSSFETGIMHSGWKSAWITDGIDINHKPAGYFRKEFDFNKKIRSARAYIAVAGLFELYVNGARIGDHQLDPMYTRFDRRNLYVTHDITQSLREGKNTFGIILGNGWYNHQSTA
ncbi:MAG: alpha-L-rhamnosidase N-terminal domain-containing protein, partial [Flavitalea sp.]